MFLIVQSMKLKQFAHSEVFIFEELQIKLVVVVE